MNLIKATGSTRKIKRIGRGQSSGMDKTATKGGKGQAIREGHNEKGGSEGGQQPPQRGPSKVGFISKVEKPYVINAEKITAIKDLSEITFESIKSVYRISKSASKIKLTGASARDSKAKVKDENISLSGIK